MTNTFNRRSFLKGAAMASVAAGAGLLSSTTMALADEVADGARATEPTWDAEAEVVVVGFGGAGSVAALTAFEQGSSVVVLEKAAHTGGGISSVSGANTCAVADADACYEYARAALQGTTPDAVLRAWADEGATLTAWLDEHNIGYEDRGTAVGFPALASSDEIARNVTLTDPEDKTNAGGHYFMQQMAAKLEESGVEVLFGCRADLLIQDPATKEVLGVRAQTADGEFYVKATKAVILASGGFECNDEMMANYVRPYPIKPAGWPLNEGDGHIMAMKAGAAMWHMGMVCGSGYVFDEPDHVVGRTNFKNYVKNGAFLFVNRTGQRFQCEHPAKYWSHLSQFDFDTYDQSRGLPTAEYRDIPFYIIFDETLRTAGSLFPDEGKISGLPLVPADLGGQDHKWSEDNLEEVEMGWILKGETLEELAAAINADAAEHNFALDGETLTATVDRFNSMCEAGEDTDFARPAEVAEMNNLIALNNPPYYAMRFVPCLCSTCGGPEKNEYGQLVDLNGEVIPRLYGAGVISHIAGVTYPFAGTNWSEVFNGGRIAGRNAAAEEVRA